MSGSSASSTAGRLKGWVAGLLAAVVLGVAGAEVPAQTVLSPATLQTWGLQTYNSINSSLKVPGTALYAETASLDGTRSGGLNNRAFVWAQTTQFRAMNSLTQLQPGTYSSTLRTFSDQLRSAYWNNGYRSGAGTGARFYDDNAHVAVALAEAYRITGDTTYLTRAQETYNFVLSGEDSAGGGGIYFQQGVTTSKDSISTLQGARSAAMLYRATGQASYLTDAQRLMTWANTHVQQSNGLFAQGYVLANSAPGGVDIVNSAGVGISANIELYDATHTASYLVEAERIARAAYSRYFDSSTGRINDEGYWAFELIDALDNLYLHDHNAIWLNRTQTALQYLYNNKQDPNGHYGLFWGRDGKLTTTLTSWNLNEQAAVARAYLYTATVPEPTTMLTLTTVATAVAMRRRRRID